MVCALADGAPTGRPGSAPHMGAQAPPPTFPSPSGTWCSRCRRNASAQRALTDELELRTSALVPSGHAGEDLEHRLGGGGAVRVDGGRRVDLADRCLAPERADHDVLADAGEAEL